MAGASKWENTFRLRGHASGAKGVLAILFWMWGIPGLIMNSANLLLLKGNVTVEISTYLSAATLIWIGGMILFGVGALIMRGHFAGQRPSTPDLSTSK